MPSDLDILLNIDWHECWHLQHCAAFEAVTKYCLYHHIEPTATERGYTSESTKRRMAFPEHALQFFFMVVRTFSLIWGSTLGWRKQCNERESRPADRLPLCSLQNRCMNCHHPCWHSLCGTFSCQSTRSAMIWRTRFSGRNRFYYRASLACVEMMNTNPHKTLSQRNILCFCDNLLHNSFLLS